PANGSTLSGTTTVSATASDEIGVTKVEFYCDTGTLIGSSTPTPSQSVNASVTWNTTAVANGNHTIYVKAYDAAGNSATSSSASVAVNNSTSIPGQLQWVKGPTGGNTSSAAVAADRAGNVVSVGQFSGTVNLGAGSVSSTLGSSDAFVLKYDS